ncbi:O-antigen ligase family protein, partial [Candidatus Sumerlaeota bacterium]|nr:O-antigen ligase family protein [Candidatus Sumerlaeota bacterium]
GTGRSKWTLPALLLCLLPLIIFSAGIRHQIGSIFNPDTYKTDANVRLRIEAWKTSMQIIGDHPVTGIGYGWPNFESIYPHYNAEKLDTEDKPHAHNNFLEIAVETGLTGTTIFIAWQLMLLYGVFLLIRDAASGTPERALGWALLGLMVSIHLFGMTNYSLRRNVGFEIWLGWGILHAGLTSALQRLWWEKENSNAPIPFG